MAYPSNNKEKRRFCTIDEAPDLSGVRVLLRAALNVPLANGAVRDDFRIQEACETIRHLTGRGARVIVLAHIGREPHETLAPVHEAMQKFVPIAWAGGLTDEAATGAASSLEDGDALLLENVRSDERETANDETFAKALAAYGDMYVNDAFADSHRAHASIVGIPKFLPSYAGRSFAREYEELSKAFDPVHPALFALGGAKVETKLPLVERFIQTYDHVFLGGAIVNDFFRGKGYEVGQSLVSDVDLSASALLSDPRIILPTDVTVDGPNGRITRVADAVAKDEKILDIGPQTMEALARVVAQSKTILWNGPIGDYEHGFDEATEALAKMIAEASGKGATSIIGGGDTVAAIEKLGLNDKFTFISTAGGAMLEFLERGTLPGIDALIR